MINYLLGIVRDSLIHGDVHLMILSINLAQYDIFGDKFSKASFGAIRYKIAQKVLTSGFRGAVK